MKSPVVRVRFTVNLLISLREVMKSLVLLIFFTMVPAFSWAAPISVYLLAGQSNADGRAENDGLQGALAMAQHDVLLYDGSLRPLAPDSGRDFGPEVSFGRKLADAEQTIAVIKYAAGGTSLYNDWKPGTGTHYTTFTQVVANGLQALAAGGYTPKISGFLWVQGERDARDGRSTAQYMSDLQGFVQAIQTAYGPDLPFHLSRLSSGQINLPAASLQAVRNAQFNVSASDPSVFLINTDGMSLKDDNLHFDTPGQIALGEAFADSVLSVLVADAADGDYNADGLVGQGDLNLVLLNWGSASLPPGFDESSLPGNGSFDGTLGQDELDGVLLNWGNSGTSFIRVVPEPGTVTLFGFAVILGCILRL
ncbi:MAG: sialate O-acetylesterase [Planctomycetota bacterium]